MRDLARVRAELRSILYLALARLPEKDVRAIVDECLGKEAADHYQPSGR